MTLEELFVAITRAPFAEQDLDGTDLAGANLARAIDARRVIPGRWCSFAHPATVSAAAAVYVHDGPLFPGPRWLDICWAHYAAVKDLGLITDPEIAVRYARWLSGRDADARTMPARNEHNTGTEH